MSDDTHRRSWRNRNLARGRTPTWIVPGHDGIIIGTVKLLSGGTFMALDPCGEVVGFRRTREAAIDILRK
jgi:hypothetical protein